MEYSSSSLSLSLHLLSSPSLKPLLYFPPPNFTLFRYHRINPCLSSTTPLSPVVVARAGSSSSSSSSHCEPSSHSHSHSHSHSSSSSSNFSLNTPLEPRSSVGRYLTSVFQNQRPLFHVAVSDELKLLTDDRDAALSRMFLSSGSTEASLHRRIAQLKERECQIAVEDVMYMLIFYKFAEIRVPLVPKLSSCIYNGRLEIWPSKDWELESIHSFQLLEMIREHVSTVIGLRANSSVTDNWATTEIQRLQLSQVYVASILYGYFLKSASLRHHLEHCLAMAHQDLHLGHCHRTTLQFSESLPHGLANLVFGRANNIPSASLVQGSNKQDWKRESLRCYIMGFDAAALQTCAKLKSKEAVSLVEKHSRALFGDEKTGLLENENNDQVIVTSFSSLKRLVLEAVSFGSFLWDAEEHVDSLYKLKQN